MGLSSRRQLLLLASHRMALTKFFLRPLKTPKLRTVVSRYQPSSIILMGADSADTNFDLRIHSQA